MESKWEKVFLMMTSTYKKVLYSTLSILFVFLLWEIIVVTKKDDFLFPGFQVIFKRCFELLFSSEVKVLFATLFRVIVVIIISLFISLILSFLYYKIPNSIHFFRPIMSILKAAPFAIISVYVFFAMKREIAPYLISALVVLPITFEGIVSAIDNIEQSIKDELAMLEISSLKKFSLIYLPICSPYIVMTLLQSFGLGLKIMIMSEYICQIENSVGIILVNVKYNMEFDKVLAWLVIVVFIVCMMDLLIRTIGKKYNPLKNEK